MITNEDTFRSYPSKIAEIYNNWPKVEDEGTGLTLTPVRKGKMILEPTGKTSQNGTPTPDNPVDIVNATGSSNVKVVGKNLFKIPLENGSLNGITWVINENGSITLNGTSTNHTNINSQSINMPVVVGETYTISATNITVGNIGFKELNGNDIWVLTSNTLRKTQTINNNIKTKDIMFAIYIPPNRTLDNVTITFQLEKSSTATEYEDYKEQNYTINFGKNLFNYNDLVSKIQTFNISGTADEFTITGVGTYQYPISLKGQHTISGSWSTTNLNGDVRAIYEDDTFDNIFSSYSSTSTSGNINFQSNTSKNIKAIQFRTFNSSNITFTDFQIEKGSTATSYSPYFTPIELCKIGNYKDRIYYNNGKWYLEKNIGKVVLDGSETGSAYQESSHRYYRTINDMYNYETQNRYYDLITNRFYPSATIQNQVGYCFHYQKSIYLYMPTTITTIEEANIWLSTHNTTVYYVLETPTITEITEQDYPTLYEELNSLLNAKSYNGITNIIITGDTPVNIKAAALMKGGN